MRRACFVLLSALLLLVGSSRAWSAPAYDTISSGGGVTGNFSWTHTPVGTPRGVVVWVVGFTGTDEVTGVTYGGTAMTECGGSPNILATGESGVVHCFFLGASVPPNAQTVAVTTSGSTVAHGSVAVSLTAAADLELVDSDGSVTNASLANPAVTLSVSGRASWCGLGAYSGQNDPTTGTTPLSNWTSRNEGDAGAESSLMYAYDIVGTSDVTAGWTQTADDAVMVAIAVAEVVGGSPLAIDTTSLPDGTVGVAYSQSVVASGGTAPYTFGNNGGGTSLNDGSAACAGLSINTSGLVSGTPTTSGACSWTASVTDNAAGSDTQALTITVNAPSTQPKSLMMLDIGAR